MRPQTKGSLPQVLDSTMMAEWRSCPTKFYWSFIRQLGSPRPSIDLIAGGCFAKGLEELRKAFYGHGKSLEESLMIGMSAAMTEWPDGITVPSHKEGKSLDRVLEALAFYIQEWNPKTDHLQPVMENGMPAVERTFSIPLPINHPETGQPFIYAGRYDMLAEYRGQLVIDDEKTTSQLGPTWASKWNMWGQFTGYCWAAREHGQPVLGAVVRGISFLKNKFERAEVLQLRSEQMIDSWYTQLIFDVQRMVDAWTHGWFDQNFADSCAAYGGCGFQVLCQTNMPDAWVDGRYAKREWNPLKKVPMSEIEGSALQLEAGIALPEGVEF